MDNRIAYGLAKKYGIDTKDMSPKEVWEALKNKGVTEENISDGAYNSQESKAKELVKKVTEKKGNKERRTEAKDVIKKIKTFEGKEEGTYDYESGKLVELKDGYMVTFHQNEPDEEGHYKSHYGRYTEEEYDEMTNNFASENDAKIYVGVFDGEPEISFKVKTFEQAKKLMIKYNQKSLWNNARTDSEENPYYDKNKNPMRRD